MKLEPTKTSEPSQPEQLKTESWSKKALRNFGVGAVSGSGIGFTTIIIMQFSWIGSAWFGGEYWFFLVIATIEGLLLGIPVGGFGGLILGSIWKHRRAAIIGGFIPVLILALVINWWTSGCAIFAGC